MKDARKLPGNDDCSDAYGETHKKRQNGKRITIRFRLFVLSHLVQKKDCPHSAEDLKKKTQYDELIKGRIKIRKEACKKIGWDIPH